MQRDQRAVSISILGHLLIGMGLGSIFALALLFGTDSSVLQLILDDSSPTLVLVLYIGVFAMTFGLGATLTGLLLEAPEDRRTR